jgi:predicted O-methyltransferase YrrM
MKNSRHDLGPTALLEMATGFWVSKALMAAVELDIFTKLSGKLLTMHQIQELLDLPNRYAESFIMVLLSLGLLTWKKHETEGSLLYMNSGLADTYLVRGKSNYVGDFITMYDKRLYKKWEGLTSAIKSGRFAAESSHLTHTERTPGSTLDDLYNQAMLGKEKMKAGSQMELEMFVRAMYGEKISDAIALCQVYDFSKHRKLIDLGGGPAVFSIQIVRNFSDISVLVIDTKPVCKIANEYIQRFNVQDRIKTKVLDFIKEDLPKGYDVIFMSHIVAGMSKRKNLSLLKKVYNSLPKRGTIIINEWLLDDDRTGPTLSALMGLNMVLETTEGKSYSFAEVSEMLTEAGFTDIEKKPISNSPGHVILGYKRTG